MKVLVLYAGYGGGHKAAAEAIYEELLKSNCQASCVDALDFRPSSKQSYRKIHLLLGANLPFLWKFIYFIFDSKIMQSVSRVTCKFLENLFHYFKPLNHFLKQEQFDYIINTQSVTTQLCVYLKRSQEINAKLICVITDFYPHYSWVSSDIDCYAVASDYTKNKLIQAGIQKTKIVVTGIPIKDVFMLPQNIAVLKEKFRLKENLFTVLITAGSLGVGPVNALVSSLTSCQLIVVCGHNKKLYNQLKLQECDRIRVYEFVDNMHELISVADIVLAKPGGLSIAEALAKNLPLIFFTAIPGQETRNIKVLEHYSISSKVLGIKEIIAQIDEYSRSPQKLDAVKSAMKLIARPHAVRSIVNLVEQMAL